MEVRGKDRRGEILGRSFSIHWTLRVTEKEDDALAYDLSVRWMVVPSVYQKTGQKRERLYKAEGHLSSAVSAV